MPPSKLDLPSIINLGVYRGGCPCSCVHCPVGRTPQHLRQRHFGTAEIDPVVFELFCDQLNDCGSTVRIHAVGEPTLHTAFSRLLDAVRSRNLTHRFWLFTCGIFHPSLIPQLVDSIGIIEISLNSIESEDYLRTKGVDQFDKVLDALESMRCRIEKEKLGTRLVLTRVASEPEADKCFEKHWRARGFECFVRSYHDYSGLLRSTNLAEFEPTGSGPKCFVPWKRFNLDGTIEHGKIVAITCFNELFKHPSHLGSSCQLGVFPELSLKELWNSKKFSAFREHMTRQRKTGTACDKCNYCMIGGGLRAENLVKNC